MPAVANFIRPARSRLVRAIGQTWRRSAKRCLFGALGPVKSSVIGRMFYSFICPSTSAPAVSLSTTSIGLRGDMAVRQAAIRPAHQPPGSVCGEFRRQVGFMAPFRCVHDPTGTYCENLQLRFRAPSRVCVPY
mmetsp:Transcript_50931/g.148333  ORF Transcript_50931/g.148333 Transcript_50931/m.148333 type:complete len:133 (-) Transcript_50931:55-453(-)